MGFAFNPLVYLASLAAPLALTGAVGWALVRRGLVSRALAAAIVVGLALAEYAVVIVPQRGSPESERYAHAAIVALAVGSLLTIAILVTAKPRAARPVV